MQVARYSRKWPPDIRRVSVRHCRSWICARARAGSVQLVARHAVSLGGLPIGAVAVDFCRSSRGVCNLMIWPRNRRGAWAPTVRRCADWADRAAHSLHPFEQA